MKKIMTMPSSVISKVTLFFSALLCSLLAVAQDKKVDVNIGTKTDSGSGFLMQPWVWIVGGAVFLLLLVALLRNNNSKN
ncbi:MAG: hypothetical protein ABIO05_09685 [Ferruginibacter sp.]